MNSRFLKYTILIILFLVSLDGWATAETDSLNLSFRATTQADTAFVDELILEVRQNLFSDVLLAQKYALQALEISTALNYEKGKAYSNFYLAQVCLDYDFKCAEEYLIKTLEYAEKANDTKLLNSTNNTLGILYQNVNNYKKALDYFQKLHAFYQTSSNDSLLAGIHNNLAISHEELDNDSLALHHYLQAVKINIKYENWIWLAYNYQNLGSFFLKSNTKAKAEEYLQKSLELAEQTQHGFILPQIYFNMYELAQQNNESATAIQYAQQALRESRKKSVINIEYLTLKAITKFHESQNRIDSAWFYQKQLLAISDSINQMNDVNKIQELELKSKIEQAKLENEMKLQILEAEKFKKELVYIVIILLAILLLLVSYLLYRWQKKRLQQRKILYENVIQEKGDLQNQLEYKNKESTTHLIFLQKRNDFLKETINVLNQIAAKSPGGVAKQIKAVVLKLDKNIGQEIWPEFELRFKEIHSTFYKNLTQQYPGLTPNELKLCAFLKLNLSTKDISELTRQNPDTIKVARYRLRKKLGLARSENIISFLNQI